MNAEPRHGHRRRYASLALLAAWLATGNMWATLGAAAALGLVTAAAAGFAALRRSGARQRQGGAWPGARRWAGAGVVARAAAAEGADAAIALGVDPAGRQVSLSDRQLAAHALIVGASGAGKSTTLLGILSDQIGRGRPVVAIDMKGSPAFARQLRHASEAAGRGLRVWTPDGPEWWNPLAHGNATALKDKLISTERFSEPHYQRAAERYVQTALQVLHAAHPGRPAELHEVVAVMEPRRLAKSLRAVPLPLADRVQDYLSSLTADQLSAVRGLGTRLALLSESTAGAYLSRGPSGSGIDLGSALEGGDVVAFSLNSSVYGKLAAQLGTLVIQDLVSAAGHRLERDQTAQATVAIDEFSALEADNVLALLARGREAGVSVVLATQELSDLDRAAFGLRDQVLGNTAVKIAHRQDVPSSAQTIALMAGTERVWEETEQIRTLFGSQGGSRGTRRQVDRLIVHPNEIKALQTGQAVLLAKTPVTRVARVQVRPPQPVPPRAPDRPTGPRPVAARAPHRLTGPRPGPAPAPDRPGGSRRGSATGRDQPAPGVTR